MQKLFFDVDNFIMLGSPTGLFCALRGINPSQQTPLGSLAAGALDPAAAPGCLPVCRRFYNVFHPYDPVAYRMEPLVQVRFPASVLVINAMHCVSDTCLACLLGWHAGTEPEANISEQIHTSTYLPAGKGSFLMLQVELSSGNRVFAVKSLLTQKRRQLHITSFRCAE